MKEIPLDNGQKAQVDDEDYERLARFSWYAYVDLIDDPVPVADGLHRHRRTRPVRGQKVSDVPPSVLDALFAKPPTIKGLDMGQAIAFVAIHRYHFYDVPPFCGRPLSFQQQYFTAIGGTLSYHHSERRPKAVVEESIPDHARSRIRNQIPRLRSE